MSYVNFYFGPGPVRFFCILHPLKKIKVAALKYEDFLPLGFVFIIFLWASVVYSYMYNIAEFNKNVGDAQSIHTHIMALSTAYFRVKFICYIFMIIILFGLLFFRVLVF